MADRFYINSDDLGPGELVVDGPEAKHLSVVCRVRPGDSITLFNGDGREYPARVVEARRREVVVEIGEALSPDRELPAKLTVAAPLPKGDRAHFLIEKLTELGVHRYIPLRTERSVVQPSTSRAEKLRKYVIEASKQCGRNVLMEVADPREVATLLSSRPSGVLAHPGGEPLGEPSPSGDTVFALGPEGGFTDEEVDLAKANDWSVVGLGSRILRIETAAVTLVVRWCQLCGL